MLDGLGFTGAIIPYIVVSAAIAAIVLGLREGIKPLKDSLALSRVAPLVLGALAGYLIPELHPKGTTPLMGCLYGLLAGSFSAPIYHAVRRIVASKLRGASKRADAGEETTFAADISAPKIAKVKRPEEPPKPTPLTKGDDE